MVKIALLDSLVTGFGYFEIGIVVMIIIEFAQVFKGDGGVGGGGGNPLRNIFSKAAARDEAETRRDLKEDQIEEGSERRGEQDLTEAEKLIAVGIGDAEKIKNFLRQIESTHLTPEYAKEVAARKGGALKTAVKRMLNYSERAKKEVEDAEKRNYNILRLLGSELKKRSVTFLKDNQIQNSKDKNSPQARKYDNMLTTMQRKNEAYLARVRQEGLQAAREEKQIDNTLRQVEEAEKAVLENIDALVNALQTGNTTAATTAATNAIRSLQVAETGLREAERFVEAAKRQISGIVGQLHVLFSTLKKEQIETHFEAAQAKKKKM